MKEKYVKPEIYTESLITEYLQAEGCCPEANFFAPQGDPEVPDDEFCKNCDCLESGPSY
jgi:hypothetical protein